MKFSLFVHMERWDESVSHRQLFEDLTELTLMAEAGGFSTVWIGEHHSMEYTISPSPMPLLAYLAGQDHDDPGWAPAPSSRRSGIRFGWPVNARCSTSSATAAWKSAWPVAPTRSNSTAWPAACQPPAEAPTCGKWSRWSAPCGRATTPTTARSGNSPPRPACRSQSSSPTHRCGSPPATRTSHNFAVENGCNVMVTPLMKGDEEVVDLKNKFETALDNNPDVPRPQLMVLRHTHVHADDDPDGWKVGGEGDLTLLPHLRCLVRQQDHAGQRLPRAEPGSEVRRSARSLQLEILHKTAMIGTPDEIIPRIKYYQELGVDEFSFWCDNSLPHAEKKKSLELFIKHVVPAFQ